MPIYEYRCDECGALCEVFQKMSDDPLETCEKCGGSLRKVLHPVAIHFKGSGFYTTDYGKGSGRRTGARDAAASGDAGESSGGETGGAPAAGSKGSDEASSKSATGSSKSKETQKTA